MSKAHTHAGGVVYRPRSTGVEILLVRARDDSSVWVLPKGHVELGEGEEETARREVREEAGVAARVERTLGTDSFDGPRGSVRVVYFLMRYEGEDSPDEERECRWFAADEAEAQIAFHGARRIVAHAIQLLSEGPTP